MAKRGRRASVAAGFILLGSVLVAALEWKSLARAWYVRDLCQHPRKIVEYFDDPGSIRREAALEFLTSTEGAAAILDLCFGQVPDLLEPKVGNSVSDNAYVNVSSFSIHKRVGQQPELSWVQVSSEELGSPTRWSKSYPEDQDPPIEMLAVLPQGKLLFPKSLPEWKASVVNEPGRFFIQFTPR